MRRLHAADIVSRVCGNQRTNKMTSTQDELIESRIKMLELTTRTMLLTMNSLKNMHVDTQAVIAKMLDRMGLKLERNCDDPDCALCKTMAATTLTEKTNDGEQTSQNSNEGGDNGDGDSKETTEEAVVANEEGSVRTTE